MFLMPRVKGSISWNQDSNISIFLNPPTNFSVKFSVESFFSILGQCKKIKHACHPNILPCVILLWYSQLEIKRINTIDTFHRQGACHRPWLEPQGAIAYRMCTHLVFQMQCTGVIILPTQTMHYEGEIPQIYHAFACLISPKWAI